MSGLALRAIGRRFGDHVVLDDVSLTLRAGECVAVLGHSGTGKTTLLRIAAGLDTDHVGTVDAPAQRAVVFQDPSLLPWKRVLANVMLGLRAPYDEHDAHRVLAEVGLDAHATRWPNTLSGGEAQRVALARALVRRPEVLLLDEPFGGLDALNRLRMQDLFVAMRSAYTPTTLFITHDVEEALVLADRVVVLADARLAYEREVELPATRQRTSSEFQALRTEVLAALGVHDH